MDFQDDEPAHGKAVIGEAAQIVADMSSTERKVNVKKDSRKGRHSLSTTSEQVDPQIATPKTVVIETISNAHSSDRKKKKKKNEQDSGGEPSAKKRKRHSEIEAASPPLVRDDHSDGSLVVSADMLGGTDANSNLSSKALQLSERKPSSKKMKSKRASEVMIREQTDDSSVERVDENTPVAAVAKKKKIKKNKSRENLQVLDASAQSVPSHRNGATSTGSPYVTTPKKTPIPLPQKSHLPPTIAAATESSKQQSAQVGHNMADVLVTETPPLQMSRPTTSPWETPIPFNQAQVLKVFKEGKESNEYQNTLVSSATANGEGGSCASAPTILLQNGRDVASVGSPPSLTTTNLLRYTQPINDEPKPRPRAWGGSVSSASSMSIKDAFARMGRPSPTASADVDPFLNHATRKKSHRKSREEANVEVFTSALHAFQGTVDLADEKTYLIQHLFLRAANDAAGQLPCLKQATGCDSNKEKALVILRSDPSDLLKVTITNDAQGLAFDRSVAASLSAETFLHHAVLSELPVPTGKLEGLYTLYCPKYAETHVDKYGFGQRTLAISRPAGFTSNTFTARLSIPPRPMAYTTLAFTPAPHASFRITTLTTSAEGYTMDLVVLGNGHILLRVDLGLLLMGKKSEMGDGVGSEVCMEFRGVKERDAQGEGAMMFGALEEQVRRRFGVSREKERKEKVAQEEKAQATAAVESPTKKKRGRPSNVELARRAAEKEVMARGEM
jgi:hypothetical protein